MFKKLIAIVSTLIFLSSAVAIPVFAETNQPSSCGFWGHLFGTCTTNTSSDTESASVISSTALSGSVRTGTMSTTTLAAQIACAGTAVATREASLDTAMTTYTQALNSAYNTRATDLASAYAQTTMTGVRAGIKVAWTTFNTSTRSAQKAWQGTRSTTWSTFRTAVKACKAPATVTDSANSVSEMSGE